MKADVKHWSAATLALTFATIPAAAMAAAASDTSVVIPLGDWAAAAISFASQLVLPVVTILVGWAFRLLPASISAYLKTLQVEQLLAKSISYGLTAARGAAAGRVLTANVGNDVLAKAARYAVDHAPDLVRWAGGEERLREKILARLDVEPAVSVKTNDAGKKELAL